MEQRRICPYCMQELEAGEEQCPHCGRELAGRNPAGSLPAGTVLAGRYTVGDIQSVDGEGILYRGVENNGPFRVTIKEYMPLTLAAERGRDCILRPKPGSEVLFKTTRMDFADLYRFIQRITPANGLEAVLDVFEENNTVYAVMENPGGCPLQKWLEEHGTVTPQQACAMLEPVFNGVEAMHQVGLVHRGICPANIRIMDNGRARLTGYATVGLRTAGSGLHEQLYEGFVVGLVEDDVEFPRADALSSTRFTCQQFCQQSGRQGRPGRHGQQGAGRFEAEADVLQWFSHRRQPGCRQHDVA